MRVFSVQFTGVAVAAVQDLFDLLATTGMAFKVHEVRLGQITTASVGNLRVSLRRLPGTVTVGSGGATATPQKMNFNDAAATFTARTNDTAQATTSGTASIIVSDVFNVINGWLYLPAPEDRPIIAPGQALIVSLDSAPSASETMSGTIVVEELF